MGFLLVARFPDCVGVVFGVALLFFRDFYVSVQESCPELLHNHGVVLADSALALSLVWWVVPALALPEQN